MMQEGENSLICFLIPQKANQVSSAISLIYLPRKFYTHYDTLLPLLHGGICAVGISLLYPKTAVEFYLNLLPLVMFVLNQGENICILILMHKFPWVNIHVGL